MINNKNYIFVYGSLRESINHPLRNLLVRHGSFLGTGSYQGKLYDLGRYPGAIPSTSRQDRVVGEIFRLQEAEHVLKLLDKYEGPRFKREIVKVAIEDDAIPCWAYLYKKSPSGRTLIPSGDYVEYCKFLERLL